MTKIKLDSRYKDVATIFHPIDEAHGIISTTGNYVRVVLSEDNTTIKAVDFEGGPMLYIGDTLNNKKIKSIKTVYYVELE